MCVRNAVPLREQYREDRLNSSIVVFGSTSAVTADAAVGICEADGKSSAHPLLGADFEYIPLLVSQGSPDLYKARILLKLKKTFVNLL